MKILIIGGVAGGASTAARLRRLDEQAEIIMFEKGKYISFANCGLPYYVGETIKERGELLLQTPESFNARFNIDVRVENEVLQVIPAEKKVKVIDHSSGNEYTESYDKLLLSPGSTPLRPPIPGIDNESIFTLWTVDDVDKIKIHVDHKKPKKAVVIGGGFIGLEMAENLVDRGIEVDLVELLDQVMAPLDFEMAQIVHQELGENGVKLHLGNGVKEFLKEDDKTIVVLQDGTAIETDMVMLSLGIKSQTAFLNDSGIKLNKRGGIVVNDYLQTSNDDIYAVGDAVEIKNFINGEQTMIPLAGPANRQGRMAAGNMLGGKEKYKGTQGTSIAKVFELHAGSTGLNEKQLKQAGKKYGEDYLSLYIHPKSHAGYYPGAMPLHLKMLFTPDKKILGAQAVGAEGVDKRIDVIAAAIRSGADTDTLMELELAYAPPFSSAKDPVNMAGFVAENMLEGVVKQINVDMLDSFKEAVLLDIRTQEENSMGTIPDSLHIDVNQLREKIDTLDKNQTYIVYCAIGVRGYIAARILMQNGFKDVYNLAGGYTSYQHYNYSPSAKKSQGAMKMARELENITTSETTVIDATGLSCPGPIMRVKQELEKIKHGDVLEIHVTDSGFKNDIGTWCERTGNTLLNVTRDGKKYISRIRKGNLECDIKEMKGIHVTDSGNDKTIVCFSGDLDKAIAAFIIANGAVSMGRKVTIFFTFWGLNIIRKNKKVRVKKNLVSKMFGAMMPRGAKKLKLSKMEMAGMGSGMIKGLMKKHNVPMLEDMIQMAIKSGVRVIACNMSMDLMGIKEEELIDGIDFGGVASYLGAAETADTNLFI
jgi:NADPH-dependent 2,4-dienoyl-CoA reductase/sulfur reductase-like enzyme/peroxiredoxin family protein/TusA-related sulfurtransferase